jgi:hypothetical protein
MAAAVSSQEYADKLRTELIQDLFDGQDLDVDGEDVEGDSCMAAEELKDLDKEIEQ